MYVDLGFIERIAGISSTIRFGMGKWGRYWVWWVHNIIRKPALSDWYELESADAILSGIDVIEGMKMWLRLWLRLRVWKWFKNRTWSARKLLSRPVRTQVVELSSKGPTLWSFNRDFKYSTCFGCISLCLEDVCNLSCSSWIIRSFEWI